jgi:hypothetical protein
VAPGIVLVTTAVIVLAAAIGVRAIDAPLRRGPRLGVGAIGAALALTTAAIALVEGARVVIVGGPWPGGDPAQAWAQALTWAPYGAQVPVSLLLGAVAAVAMLPAPIGADLGLVLVSLAGLAAPAAFGLPRWSPVAICGALAALAGAAAARDVATGSVARRLSVAAVLALYAVAAAGPTLAATAAALGVVAIAAATVAVVGQLRAQAPAVVPGIASAAALLAVPAAAACLAADAGNTATGVLAPTLAATAAELLVLLALRTARVPWLVYPAFGVGLAALLAVSTRLPDLWSVPAWAGFAAVVAVAAGGSLPPDRRSAVTVITATAGPAALLAVVASAPVWLAALVGPYRTVRHVWHGYAGTAALHNSALTAAPPDSGATAAPHNSGTVALALLLLAVAAAGAALVLGGPTYLAPATLAPVAALVLVLPAQLGAGPAATTWSALGVALVGGLGVALSPPTTATRLLRRVAGGVVLVAGGAGLAGSLAERRDTLLALGLTLAAAGLAAVRGRDPAARVAAWLVTAGSGFGLAVAAVLAASGPLWVAAFGVLAMCGALMAASWVLARFTHRRAEAPVVELAALAGAALALLLAGRTPRYAAAVLIIIGLFLGAAALRPDRDAAHRRWLIRTALAAELAACWLLLFTAQVGLPEAYTLPFVAVAILAGVLDLRRRPDLSSWVAYGPALVGGFLPSLVLVLVRDEESWRWIVLFAAAVGTVIVGSLRRRQAPVVAGATVAIVVAVTELVRLLIAGSIVGAVLVAVAGLVLVVFGALSEQRLRGALRGMR